MRVEGKCILQGYDQEKSVQKRSDSGVTGQGQGMEKPQVEKHWGKVLRGEQSSKTGDLRVPGTLDW